MSHSIHIQSIQSAIALSSSSEKIRKGAASRPGKIKALSSDFKRPVKNKGVESRMSRDEEAMELERKNSRRGQQWDNSEEAKKKFEKRYKSIKRGKTDQKAGEEVLLSDSEASSSSASSDNDDDTNEEEEEVFDEFGRIAKQGEGFTRLSTRRARDNNIIYGDHIQTNAFLRNDDLLARRREEYEEELRKGEEVHFEGKRDGAGFYKLGTGEERVRKLEELKRMGKMAEESRRKKGSEESLSEKRKRELEERRERIKRIKSGGK